MTENELLEALRGAMTAEDTEGVTVEEVAAALGLSGDTVRRRLRPMLKDGAVVRVRKRIVDMGGRTIPVNAYKVSPARS